jgi:hypothetical protein
MDVLEILKDARQAYLRWHSNPEDDSANIKTNWLDAANEIFREEDKNKRFALYRNDLHNSAGRHIGLMTSFDVVVGIEDSEGNTLPLEYFVGLLLAEQEVVKDKLYNAARCEPGLPVWSMTNHGFVVVAKLRDEHKRQLYSLASFIDL